MRFGKKILCSNLTSAADHDNNTTNISVWRPVWRRQWRSLHWRLNPALSSWFRCRTGDYDDNDDDTDDVNDDDNDDEDDDDDDFHNVQTEPFRSGYR